MQQRNTLQTEAPESVPAKFRAVFYQEAENVTTSVRQLYSDCSVPLRDLQIAWFLTSTGGFSSVRDGLSRQRDASMLRKLTAINLIDRRLSFHASSRVDRGWSSNFNATWRIARRCISISHSVDRKGPYPWP